MKSFLIFILVVLLSVFTIKDFIKSGKLEKFLDNHPNPSINSAIEYYWGMALTLSGHKESAKYRFGRMVKIYPKSKYTPLAWEECITIFDEENNNSKILEEGNKFLEIYPDHPKAQVIRKKMAVIQHGI